MIEQRAGRAALVLAVAAALVGLIAGAVTGLFEHMPYRADETLVLVRGSTPLSDPAAARSIATTIRALGDSRVVTGNVARALGLPEAEVRSRTDVSLVGETATLRLRARAPSSTQAVQLAQQYGLVLTALVRSRFAPVALSTFDPAHASGRVSRPWARNLLAGALVGALAGIAGAVFLLRRSRTAGAAEAQAEAGPPAEQPPPLSEPAPVPGPAPLADPQPAPGLAPAPEPDALQRELEPYGRPAPPEADWSLPELRRRVEAARELQPERIAEWETYLDLLAEHQVDGRLPASFAALIDDVFGSLLY
jgi:capsular polysaccharide biosynthesis protein